jgi:autotransporter-associated beta strand protein
MNAITTILAVLRHSAGRIISSVAPTITVLAIMVAPAGAQIIGFTCDPTTTQYGTYQNTANNGVLNIGRTMTVSGSGIEVFQLGVFNYITNEVDGLATAHTVTLFDDTPTAIASVTVPAGTAAPLINAFRFAPLSTPLFLSAGNYSIVAYHMDDADPYGNGNAPGFNGGGNVSPGDGIYDFVNSPSPAYPANTGDPEEFAAVSFTYTNVTPATGVWTGGGPNNNWSMAGNWNGLPIFPAELTFAGSTRLANTNDNTGITVDGITFDAAAGAFVLNGNDITLAGNIGFSADGIGSSVNPATPVTQTINLNMALATDLTIDAPTNGNLTLNGAITSGNDLFKLDAGTLTLVGTNAVESMDINGGTNIITGNTTLNGNGVSYDRFYLGDGDTIANCSGTLIIQPGAVLSVTGNFNDSFVIGRDSGSGTVIQNGGIFTFNCNQQYLWVGATSEAGTTAAYDMNGGLLDMSGNTLGIALGNGVLTTCVVNQVNGVITNVGNLWIGWGSGHGVYTLSGGSIYIGSTGITTTSGNYAINLGGGTVGAEASWSSPLNMNLTNLNGSVTFDTGAGNNITLSGALSGNGGLTVTDSGTLELSGPNTYTGDTTVNSGSTLQLDVTGSSPGAFGLANGALLNLNYSGTYAVAHFYTNGVALPAGVYNSGNLPAFITGSGSLTLVAAAAPVVNSPVISDGNLILTGSGGSPGGSYTLLTSTNLTIPIADWTTNTTGTFGVGGAFSNAIPVGNTRIGQFFLLLIP